MARSELKSTARALAALDGHPSPAAKRFDDGAELTGHVDVLPSAFNPPTLAHFRLLRLAAGEAGQTAALLTTRNVAKEVHGASLEHRVGMLLAARSEIAGVSVLATNAARFVDQAVALREAFAAAQFDFVAGYDTLVRIFDTRYYADMEAELARFFAHHRLVVTNRGPDDVRSVREFVRQPSVARYTARIIIRELDEESAAMSSTAARAQGHDGPRPLLHRAVAEYIREHGLYQE